MGPRPEGRGNRAGAAMSGPATPELQWGRGPKAAETRRRDGDHRSRRPASMGPRPEGRGNLPGGANSGPVARAPFNGAAARRPRKPRHTIFLLTLDSCLQWGRGPKAAETGGRGVAAGAGDALQWGRGPKAAETHLLRDHEHRRCPPSMGPRPEGRGNPKRPEGLTIGDHLQWGRGPKAAETGRRLHAAPGDHSPSMGPRPEGRGNTRPGGRAGVALAPSMGPRPEGRGNSQSSPLQRVGRSSLQWGRGPKAAETEIGGDDEDTGAFPSMGPRPEGRGNSS